MANNKKYWKGLEELHEDPQFIATRDNEFSEEVSVEKVLGDEKVMGGSSSSRRDFLKFLGFSVAAASLAACETPVIHAIPYVVKPEDINPGVADWYASTFYDGHDYCPILVKTREGRPIKIKGNNLSEIETSATNARANSSLLMLYDNNRYQHPMMNNKKTSWTTIDASIMAGLKSVAASGKQIALLTPTIISPTTTKLIGEFQAAFKSKNNGAIDKIDQLTTAKGNQSGETETVKHIMYDAVSYSAMIAANQKDFGMAAIPSYFFNKAKTIVSVGADFLVNWLSSIQNAAQYAQSRNPDGKWMSKHYQFESLMSVTGSNADVRLPIKPSQEGQVLLSIYNIIASKLGAATLSGKTIKHDKVTAAAADLLKHKGAGLVVSGANNEYIQTLTNGINSLLENYGNAIDLKTPLNIKQGRDGDMQQMIKDMNSGKIGAVIVQGVDPVHTLPNGDAFSKALAKVKMNIAIATKENATSKLCHYICADNHYLESWGDANPEGNYYSLQQPAISTLFKTRQFQDSLLKWSGKKGDFYHYLKDNWNKTYITKKAANPLVEQTWDKILKRGTHKLAPLVVSILAPDMKFRGDLKTAASKINADKGNKTELFIYQKTGIGDGQGADNPWLQELPDPISKATWDNYATVSLTDANKAGFNTHYGQQKPASMIELQVNGKSYKLPVIAQPGQASGTVGIALGYGKKVGKMKNPVGLNAYPFRTMGKDGNYQDKNYKVSYKGIDEEYPIACTQTQYTLMGRSEVFKEATLEQYKNDKPEEYNERPFVKIGVGTKKFPITGTQADMWKEHKPNDGLHWGMSIDLNSCIGCGACVTSCIQENNIAVVGKDEVRRFRDMQWLRIDRYYSSSTKPKDEKNVSIFTRNKEEEPEDEKVEVAFMPILCQQCDHAPCETVCPVAATTHSEEGLNMMAYNRCIGTRYCANNCPYKVRRFNWWNYQTNPKFKDFNPSQDKLARFVLNPDVTVRSRGVMEKCSFCVQRIQAGKLVAKKKGVPIPDGSITPACAETCPTKAITFGDQMDKNSRVRKLIHDKRAFRPIEEVGTQANVYYQVKIRNSDQVRVIL